MATRSHHDATRNGTGKPATAARRPRATAGASSARPATEETAWVPPPTGGGLETAEAALEETVTERQRAVAGLNLTKPEDLRHLRDLLAPEYDTLAACRDHLLGASQGQYVLIHRAEVRVHADLDSALEEGYAHYPHDLFFVGRVQEQDFNEYLATRSK